MFVARLRYILVFLPSRLFLSCLLQYFLCKVTGQGLIPPMLGNQALECSYHASECFPCVLGRRTILMPVIGCYGPGSASCHTITSAACGGHIATFECQKCFVHHNMHCCFFPNGLHALRLEEVVISTCSALGPAAQSYLPGAVYRADFVAVRMERSKHLAVNRFRCEL